MKMANVRQVFLALGLAVASATPALLATSIAVPARAQVSVSISFDNFHSRLSPYGTWSHHSRWGEVWHPTRVARGFRPYYNGHWVNTREYGWLWVSAESWGDIPYHYGRWVFDPSDGWLWVPGYVWGPSWVVWRSGGGHIGWLPMPPGDNYYGDGAYRDDFNNQYGYRDWYGSSFGSAQFLALWIFVGEDHFLDRDFRKYAAPQSDYGRFISQTRDSTNYVTVNNYVVNRSIDANRLPRSAKQAFQPVAASSVIGRNALVTQATVGRQVEQRERQQHPIPGAVAAPQVRAAPAQMAKQPPRASGGNAGGPEARSSAVVQPRSQPSRAAPTAAAPPPAHEAPAQNANANGQDSRITQRGQGNAPAASAGQGKPNGNQGQSNNQGGANKADSKKAADDKKGDGGHGKN